LALCSIYTDRHIIGGTYMIESWHRSTFLETIILIYCSEGWSCWTLKHSVQCDHPSLQWSRLMVSDAVIWLLDCHASLYAPAVVVMSKLRGCWVCSSWVMSLYICYSVNGWWCESVSERRWQSSLCRDWSYDCRAKQSRQRPRIGSHVDYDLLRSVCACVCMCVTLTVCSSCCTDLYAVCCTVT